MVAYLCERFSGHIFLEWVRCRKPLNAYRVQPVGSSWDDIASVHGVMGLTPRSTGSGLKLLSPFMTMASQGLLDENIISLRLREPRESI